MASSDEFRQKYKKATKHWIQQRLKNPHNKAMDSGPLAAGTNHQLAREETIQTENPALAKPLHPKSSEEANENPQDMHQEGTNQSEAKPKAPFPLSNQRRRKSEAASASRTRQKIKRSDIEHGKGANGKVKKSAEHPEADNDSTGDETASISKAQIANRCLKDGIMPEPMEPQRPQEASSMSRSAKRSRESREREHGENNPEEPEVMDEHGKEVDLHAELKGIDPEQITLRLFNYIPSVQTSSR